MGLNNNQQTDLILASNSPRRKELLALGGWQFQIIAADIDETPLNGEPAPQYVCRLAEAKARAVGRQVEGNQPIIAADTTVADGDKILGKPQDAVEAREMLLSLRGRVHQVHTAVAVYQPATGNLYTDLATTNVPMRMYSMDEIEAYIATGDPFDKAGSYAIQHPGFRPVSALSGCYANVVGLPLCHLLRTLQKIGMSTAEDLPASCQHILKYTCDVYPQVQKGEL